MLDQNTDRMWYVIGAVLVGAAIILLANGTLPQIFASVSESFEGVLYTVVAPPITYEDENIISPDDLRASFFYGSTLVDYNSSTDTWTIDIEPGASQFSGGLDVLNSRVRIPYGMAYRLSYEILAPVALSSNNDIDNSSVTGDLPGSGDNDRVDWRKFSGNDSVPGEWTEMWFEYYNYDEKNNVNKSDLFDNSEFGVVNDTDEVVRVQIRNVKAHLGTFPK